MFSQGHGRAVFANISVTCNVTFRIAILCLALGLLSQGCTVQKRSHLPGWYVERATQRVGHHAATASSEVSEVPEELDAFVNVEAELAEQGGAVAVAPVPQVPPTPLSSLEAHLPFRHAIKAFQKPRARTKAMTPEKAESTRDVEHDERDVRGLLYSGLYWLVGAIGWFVFRNADPDTAGPFMLFGVVGGAWLVAFFIGKFLINRRRQSMGKARLNAKALIGLGLAIAMAAALVEIATFDLEFSFGG